jgi:hypothetical protein
MLLRARLLGGIRSKAAHGELAVMQHDQVRSVR